MKTYVNLSDLRLILKYTLIEFHCQMNFLNSFQNKLKKAKYYDKYHNYYHSINQ